MNRDSSAVFDGDRFIAAVLAYMDRHRVSARSLLAAAGLDLSSGLQVLRGDRAPSLLVACSLADVCDLSIDDYRRPLLNGGDAA